MAPRQKKHKCAHFLKGIGVSPGIAISKVFLLQEADREIEPLVIEDEMIDTEINRFREALSKAKIELQYLQNKVVHRIGHESARIFDVHQLLLNDNMLIDETIDGIRVSKKSADLAFSETMKKYQNTLSQSHDEFFQSRISDLKDVCKRVIRHIQGDKTDHLNKLKGAAILIAPELTPSETVKLDKHKVKGFATDLGGRTSHVAIMARSMEVPAVVGLREISKVAKENDRVIIDGSSGCVLIEPDDDTISYYRDLQEKHHKLEKKLARFRDLPCITIDGKEIELSANLEFSDEIQLVKLHGARGVGLYRTDYLYLAGHVLPDEELQLKEYRQFAERIAPDPVILRTMDIGGDKQPKSFEIPDEENPFLGWRAIRISLENKDLFNIQLRAALQASFLGNVKLLFPMISGIGEVRECKIALERAKEELRTENKPFNENIEIGVMIEVPSAALLADKIAHEVDFLSLGTNDLVQYTLAVDRGNERISYLYKHLHPAVLRLIKHVIQAGHREGVWVGMCGEMASDPLATLILLGLDLDEFSVSPGSVPEIKKIIRSIEYREAVKIANRALEFDEEPEVEKFMVKIMRQKYKDLEY